MCCLLSNTTCEKHLHNNCHQWWPGWLIFPSIPVSNPKSAAVRAFFMATSVQPTFWKINLFSSKKSLWDLLLVTNFRLCVYLCGMEHLLTGQPSILTNATKFAPISIIARLKFTWKIFLFQCRLINVIGHLEIFFKYVLEYEFARYYKYMGFSLQSFCETI